MQKTPDFMPEFKANLPRTSHVLSHDFGFTATTGHLNPVFHTILSPGDTIKLGMDYNIRTMPLASAAFADFTVHVEYFFVPMQLLYQPFDSVIYGITDQFSSLLPGSMSPTLPLEDLDTRVGNLKISRGAPVQYYAGGGVSPVESVGQSAIRLFDLLGFNPMGIACDDPQNGNFYNPSVFPYPFMAYNCIYQYCYRLDAREAFDQSTFNLDSQYNTSTPGSLLPDESFEIKYRPLDNDYFTDLKVSPIVDVLNLNQKNTLPLAKSWLSRSQISNSDIMTSGSVGFSSSTSNSDAPTGSAHKNPQSNIQTNFGLASQNFDSTYSAFIAPYNGQDINTANIRAMFANEKLWSITGRAKKNYDEQTLAHFGFKVPHDVKHQVSKFGHDIGKIHVGEVISTAATSGAPLGEIAGKGYGQQNGQSHSFTAPCHGVVMAIFSVVMQHNYDAGIMKANCVVDRNDFYMPEYDHLGMQPLFGYETRYLSSGSVYAGQIVGWQYRYEQWKRRYNRVSGAFRDGLGSLSTWIPSLIPYVARNPSLGLNAGLTDTPNFSSYNAFVNWPTDANDIFLAQYPSVWSTAYESATGWTAIYDNDPFVVNSHINAVVVSSMSDYSLPRLDA